MDYNKISKELNYKLHNKILKSIIYLEENFELNKWIHEEFGYDSEIDFYKILVFENISLIFIDFDNDGLRSGPWFLKEIKNFNKFANKFLDKGFTREIKKINSKVLKVEFFDNNTSYNNENYEYDTEKIIIETEDYIISMGQKNLSDYYPQNFSSIEEIKNRIYDDY